MRTRTFLTRLGGAALMALALVAPAAQAQSMAAQNAAFDQRFNSWLGNAQRQNAQAQQQLWQQHLRVNGPRLQQQYQQMLASGKRSMTFQQFAYWDLMTAAGTNVQGALQHQRNQFAGQQAAHATVQQGHARYNAGWAQNSQRQSAAVANWSNQAMRGVGPYADARGGTQMLPHYLAPGQTWRDAQNNVYAQDAQGSYYRAENGGWVPLRAAR